MPATLQHTIPIFEPDWIIEIYKQHIGRTLLREGLKVTVEDRFCKLQELTMELRWAGRLAAS